MSSQSIIEIIIEKVPVQFTILQLLGEGGQSKVYKCTRKGKKDIFALKVYSKDFLKNNQIEKELFINEYRIHKELQHENILKLYDIGTDIYNYYLVFEYCESKSLSEIKINQSQLRKYSYDLLNVLSYLKSEKVLHLDLKPQNILLKKGKIKICDFGMACRCDNEVSVPTRGTLNFISPEFLLCEKISFSSDLWSVGVIMYYLHYQMLPFNFDFSKPSKHGLACEFEITKGSDELDIISNNIISKDLFIPNKYNHPIKDLIQKMLIKDPLKRITISNAMNHPYFLSL